MQLSRCIRHLLTSVLLAGKCLGKGHTIVLKHQNNCMEPIYHQLRSHRDGGGLQWSQVDSRTAEGYQHGYPEVLQITRMGPGEVYWFSYHLSSWTGMVEGFFDHDFAADDPPPNTPSVEITFEPRHYVEWGAIKHLHCGEDHTSMCDPSRFWYLVEFEGLSGVSDCPWMYCDYYDPYIQNCRAGPAEAYGNSSRISSYSDFTNQPGARNSMFCNKGDKAGEDLAATITFCPSEFQLTQAHIRAPPTED